MEWISVKDRLPKIGNSNSREFLCLCGGRTPYVLDYITDELFGGKFYLSISFPSKIFEDYTQWVTHWMPLPELPEE